jgi:DNA-binding CsgD family transcriptional regulator
MLHALGVTDIAICRVFKKSTKKAVFYSCMSKQSQNYHLQQFFTLQLWKHPTFKSIKHKLPSGYAAYSEIYSKNKHLITPAANCAYNSLVSEETAIHLFEHAFEMHKDIFIFYVQKKTTPATEGVFTPHIESLIDKLSNYIRLIYQENSYPLFLVDFPKVSRADCKSDLHFFPCVPKPALSPQVVNFTKKQFAYAQYIKLGFSNKEIAARMHKAVRTIEDAVRELKYLTGVQTKEQLVSFLRVFL